ncbi:MAG TPA: thioredoxin domain-containing protein [bacterium]|nr:thioredoxin domain-containing protein [bacterium]HQL62899.1 thioredoxin domain-containing protein [bacterium]
MAKRVGENAFAVLIVVLTAAVLLSLYLSIRYAQLTNQEDAPGKSLCSFSAEYDCDPVLLTRYSTTFGIPNSTYSLVVYSCMLFCGVITWYQRGNLWRWYVRLGLLVDLAALGISAYFAYILFFTPMPSTCVFCVGLQACSVLALLCYIALLPSARQTSPGLREGALAGMLILLCLILAALEFLSIEQYRTNGKLVILQRAHQRTLLNRTFNLCLFASQPIVQVPVDEQTPVRGSANARHTLIVFEDFQCGPCARFHQAVSEAFTVFATDTFRVAFKHFPVGNDCNPGPVASYHPLSCTAAYASEAAHRQGKFWEYADLVFTNQRDLHPGSFMQFAQELDLDLERFEKDLLSDEVRKRVAADIELGQRLGIPGTPGTLLDGRPLVGNELQPMFWSLIRSLDEMPPEALREMETHAAIISLPATSRVLPATDAVTPATVDFSVP